MMFNLSVVLALATGLVQREGDASSLAPRVGPALSRRAALLPALTALLPVRPAHAEAPVKSNGVDPYTDTRYGVSFTLPSGWTAVPQNLPDGRRLVLATDPSDETKNTNVFLAFTPTRPDYSSLGSFGNIDYVASTLIPQCGAGTCSIKNGDEQEGVMLKKETVKGYYSFDYQISQRNGATRRLQSLFTVKEDGASSILISLTAQCLEDRYDTVAENFKGVLGSFKA
jgi:hypothetical protein